MIFCILTCRADRVTHRCGVRVERRALVGNDGERRRHGGGPWQGCMSRAATAGHRCGAARRRAGARFDERALAAC